MVYDVDETALKSVGKTFGVRTTSDYSKLLDEVDSVIIATPSSTHYEMAAKAISSSKNILIEKPVCSSLDEAYKIRQLASERKNVCAVGHVERHNPAVQLSKNILDSGSYGRMVTLTTKRVSPASDRIKDVGVIMDLAIHDIDVARYLTASEVDAVFAFAGSATERMMHLKLEDYAGIFLQFQNGVYASIESNWLSPVRIRKLSASCERGLVEVDYLNQTVQQYTELDRDKQEFAVRVASLRPEPLVNELRDFIKATRTGEKPLATVDDGVRALEVVEAIYESARIKSRVDVKRR